jgi:arsenate reductase
LFNTSGESYRSGKWSEKLATVSQAQALDALASDGKLIKRPFILRGEEVLLGFDEYAWDLAFAR